MLVTRSFSPDITPTKNDTPTARRAITRVDLTGSCNTHGSPVGGFERREAFEAGVEEHVDNYGRDDDGATDQGPTRRAFLKDQEDPNRIQHRFDVADDSSIQRPHTPRHT